MEKTRVFWINVVLSGIFVHVLILPPNEAASVHKNPSATGTEENITIPNTTRTDKNSAWQNKFPSPPPMNTSAMPFSDNPSLSPVNTSAMPFNNNPPPVNTTFGNNETVPANSMIPPWPETAGQNSVIPPFTTTTENASSNSYENTPSPPINNPMGTFTTTTEYPDFFPNALPAYNEPPYSDIYEPYQPYNTNVGNGAIPAIIILRVIPTQPKNVPYYNDENSVDRYSNFGQQQLTPQSQSYVVVQQEPVSEMDYNNQNSNRNGYSDINQRPQSWPNPAMSGGPQLSPYSMMPGGFQFLPNTMMPGPQILSNPVLQRPQYPPNSEMLGGSQFLPNTMIPGPQILSNPVLQRPQYPANSEMLGGSQFTPSTMIPGSQFPPNPALLGPQIPSAMQGSQTSSNMATQEPYYEYSDVEVDVPPPISNKTLTQPDATIVKQNMGSNMSSNNITSTK